MKALPLVAPHGCSLSPEGLAAQRERAFRLGPVAHVSASAADVRVSFADEVNRAVLEKLIATERDCCSFVDVSYDAVARELRIASDDRRGREVIGLFAAAFSEVAP